MICADDGLYLYLFIELFILFTLNASMRHFNSFVLLFCSRAIFDIVHICWLILCCFCRNIKNIIISIGVDLVFLALILIYNWFILIFLLDHGQVTNTQHS